MKIEAYYDVGCSYCGGHMSTDYFTGMFLTRKQAEFKAKELGFCMRNGKNICPECLRDGKHKDTKEDF